METICAFCGVRTEFFYVIYTNVSLHMVNMQSTQLSCCVRAGNNRKYMQCRTSSEFTTLLLFSLTKIFTTEVKQSQYLFCYFNTFTASYLNTQGLNNSCLKSPTSTLVDLTFQSRALRSFSLNQLRNLSL